MAYLGNAPLEGLVSSGNIADGSITTSKIQDTAVTYPKLNSNISTSYIAEGTNLYYTDARVANYLTANTYATQSYVATSIAGKLNTSGGTISGNLDITGTLSINGVPVGAGGGGSAYSWFLN